MTKKPFSADVPAPRDEDTPSSAQFGRARGAPSDLPAGESSEAQMLYHSASLLLRLLQGVFLQVAAETAWDSGDFIQTRAYLDEGVLTHLDELLAELTSIGGFSAPWVGQVSAGADHNYATLRRRLQDFADGKSGPTVGPDHREDPSPSLSHLHQLLQACFSDSGQFTTWAYAQRAMLSAHRHQAHSQRLWSWN